jgi:TolB-like protein
MHSNPRAKLLFTLGLGLLLLGSPVRAEDRVRIALLPMVVHSAENPNYVRRGLMDMMASRLERIRDLEVIRIDETSAATTNLEKALERARKVDAKFVLFGSFTRFGTGASLDVQCAAASENDSDEPLREIFVHSGSIGDVIPDLDDLVGKVARFVIRDYTDRVVEAGETPDLPSTRAMTSLERRVEALEDALRGLSEQLSGGGPGSPAAVAEGPE